MTVLSPRLTVAEVAAELRTSERYVRSLIDRGEIGHVREGRLVFVSRAQLEEYASWKTRDPKRHEIPETAEEKARAKVKRGQIRALTPSDRKRQLEREARERGWS